MCGVPGLIHEQHMERSVALEKQLEQEKQEKAALAEKLAQYEARLQSCAVLLSHPAAS